MFKHTLFLVALVWLLASCSGSSNAPNMDSSDGGHAVSAISWSQAWNLHCADNNFTDNSLVTANTTLGDMYLGTDFASDIQKMHLAMTAELGTDSGLSGAGPEALYIWFEEDLP